MSRDLSGIEMLSRMTEKKMRTRMMNGWKGSDDTVCGKGSTLANTEALRVYLPDVIERYAIRSICDAGAGDRYWIKHASLDGIDYKAFDLVPRDETVVELDISTQPLPSCDLILCRQVLNHLDPFRVQDALTLFEKSGKYLLATTHDNKKLARYCDYSRWDLACAPFWLGEPLERIRDATATESDCFIALWKLG